MKLNIAFSLIILSLVILFIYGIKRNNNFINIFKIVTDHFKIFDGAKKRDYRKSCVNRISFRLIT